MPPRRLGRRVLRRDAESLAVALLGHRLVRVLPDGRRLSGRIVEVEAYLGVEDRAAHSFGGRRTERNRSMWLDGGHAYVYFVYGMHWCFNVVAGREGVPAACLVRALEPLEGRELMRTRRGGRSDRELCSGPAKLAQAMGLDRGMDGVDLVTSRSLFLERGTGAPRASVARGARIGVDYAGEWASRPLRFWLEGNDNVSKTPPKKRRAPPP